MRLMKTLALILLLAMNGQSIAVAPEEGMEPVNTINETGRDIGACHNGAALAYAPRNFKGISFFVPKYDPLFSSAHTTLTKGEDKWLQEMSGPSAQNREYVDKLGNRILILWFCKQSNCGTNNAYAAYNLATQEYGIDLVQIGKHRTIGVIPPASRAALACAAMIDQRLRVDTEAKMFGVKPK